MAKKEEQEIESTDENKKLIAEIRNSWDHKTHVSTLPSWGQQQNKIIQDCKVNLPEIDEETRNKITRELLFTLRCQSCERARTDQCNFSVCIRGLMSGQDIGGL